MSRTAAQMRRTGAPQFSLRCAVTSTILRPLLNASRIGGLVLGTVGVAVDRLRRNVESDDWFYWNPYQGDVAVGVEEVRAGIGKLAFAIGRGEVTGTQAAPADVAVVPRQEEPLGDVAGILVQQLVAQGLVERSEDTNDRRRTYVRLTERGAGLLAGRREQIRSSLRQWLGKMEDEGLADLERGLSALLQILHAEQGQA